MRTEPKVGIVLLNWNGYEDTASCLRSLSTIQYENHFIVVVDNGSADESGERLAEDFPDCTVLFNESNLGFAGGCNVGIEHCVNEGADHVLLLNNDIEVSPSFLGPLVRTAERHERVALVGGVIYEGKTDRVWDAGGEMNPYVANHTRYKEIKADEEYRTEFVTCAQALLTTEFLSEYGLDENFFFGVEEIDLSWQALANGWKLFINPRSEVYHEVGAALEDTYSGKELFSPFQKYHNTRGRLYHASKNLKRRHMISYCLLSISAYPLVYLWWGIRYNRPDILYAHLLAIYDYVLNSEIRRPGYFTET